MAKTQWYQNENWNRSVEEKFFEKLGRARSQKIQYIAIQAGSLVKKHPNKALELCDYYFEIREDKFHDCSVYLSMAYACINILKYDDALMAFKNAMAREAETPYQRSNVLFEYPYFVAEQKIECEYIEALQALKKAEDQGRIVFPLQMFMINAARAIILNDAECADAALQAASIKQSQFSRHRSLGLVGVKQKKMIKKMKKLISPKFGFFNFFK